MTSDLISNVISKSPSASMMRMVRERATEFRSPLEMELTAVALDPVARAVADNVLDDYWSKVDPRPLGSANREVIIGSGYHAAAYAAIRVLSGFPRPIVLERSDRVGGTFAMTRKPTFYLNSRNRAGGIGLGGDRRASLNYLPGAPIQAANLSMAEYQTNADMAFAIRLTLAEYADVYTGATVESVNGTTIATDAGTIIAGRIIDARGLGDANYASQPASNILNFGDFMKRMESPWPLRGMRRVAIIGDGDSAKCAAESLIGVGPESAMSVAALDNVERIDWYSPNLPATCEEWRQQVRGRYQGIGPSLRPDRFGERRVNIISKRAFPIALPGQPLIDGRSYDMAVMCTGNAEKETVGLFEFNVSNYMVGDTAVAKKDFDYDIYRVGPHARLAFSRTEQDNGVADIPANAVSMFRLGAKTAALAATLPAVN